MSKGNAPKERAKLLVKALLEYEINQGDRITNLGVNWAEDGGANLKVSATKQALFNLLKGIPEFRPTLTTKDDQVRKTIGESLTKHLNQFLGILEDHRTQNQKSLGDWSFTLKLWRRVEVKYAEEGISKNLEELDKLWEAKRSPQSADCAATTNITHGTAIGNIGNVENLEINNITGGSLVPQPERVAAPRRENVRLRGFNEIRVVRVWEGREQVLGELRQKVRDGLRVLVLTGQGGIGKSSLASKLMEALGIGLQPPSLGADCVYSGVVYFKVQVGTSFDDGAGQVLRDLGEEQGLDLVKPQEKIDKIITYLAGQKWLLVLDNLEDILHPASHEAAGRAVSPEWGQLLNALVYKNHCSQVIITSREMPVDLGDLRYKVKPDSSLVEAVVIPGVSVEAGVKILQRQLKDKLEDLQWMAERVGGSVFLLNQLVALGKGKLGYLRKNPKLVTKNAEPMLREQLNRQSAAAQDFLARMSILRGAVNSRGLTFVRLFVDEWQERLMAAAAVNQPLEFSDDEIDETEKLLEKLVDSSLVESRFDQEKLEDVYSLHQVIKDFLEKQIQQLPDLFVKINDFYRTEFTFQNVNDMTDLLAVIEPINFILNIGYQKEAVNLRKKIIKYAIRLGQGDFLENAMIQVPQMAEGINQTEGYLMLGGMHYEVGNWDEAERLFSAALERAILDNDCPNIAASKGCLGSIARERGNWDEAETLYKQSLAVETELGNRSGMVSSQALLGSIAYLRSNWDEAETLYKQHLEVMTELGDQSGIAYSWASLGNIASSRGNWDEAERLYKQSLEVRTELGDRSGMVSSWGELGDIARKRGNWDEAEKLFNQCLEVETELGNRSDMATSWGVLGDIARNRGKWDEAERLYKRYLKVRTELGDCSGIAYSWAALGEIANLRGNWDEAERLYKRYLKVRTELGDRYGIATSWGALGDIARKRGKWDEAERLYKQSLELRMELGDRYGVANSWGVLGDIAKKRGNWDEAERLYKQSLELRTELGDRPGIATCWASLGDITSNQGNWDEAERLYKQSLELRTELGDRSGIASSWELLGSIAYLRSNWNEAERLSKQSLKLKTELGDRSGMASSWIVLGYIAQCRGNWDEAERLSKQSLELRTELGDRSGMATSWGLLGDIARNRGNWDEAERLYLQSLAVKTELGDRPGMASNWGFLGDIARSKMNIDEAINLHQQCLEIMQELGDQRGIAVTNCDLGEDELARDNLDAAEKFLTIALMQLEAIGHIKYMGTANYALAQLWRKRGNLDLAQQHYTTATTIFQNLGAAKDLDRLQQEWQQDQD